MPTQEPASPRARTLVVTSRVPTSQVSGYDVRVANLCAHTPGELHLAVVTLGEDSQEVDAAVPGFASVHDLGRLRAGAPRLRRHLRRSDSTYYGSSWPDAFAAVVRRLTALVEELDVDVVVVFGGDLAEVVGAAAHRRVVLDVCDSVTLTLRRQGEVAAPVGLRERLRARIELARSAALEAALPRRFDVVTTISEQDSDQVRELAGPDARVVTVPNGVDERFLTGMLPAGSRHGVAFWGNLSFGPNQDCLRWFLDEVFVPHLRSDGVAVRVIGPNAPVWLEELAAAEPLVELCGFVDDLPAALADFPLAMNAMRTGSGLKNKVLEAFGLGLVVVSTTRGVEALPEVRSGTHVVVADDAVGFAAAVTGLLSDEARRTALRSQAHELLASRYRWSRVGAAWADLVRPPAG